MNGVASKLLTKTTGTLLVGAAVGYAATLLLSPETKEKHKQTIKQKSEELKKLLTDKEEQERVKEIFRENTDATQQKYRQIKTNLVGLLAQTRGAIQDIDKQKYTYAVEKALEELRTEGTMPKAQLERLKRYLIQDFQKIKSNVALN
jgi:gas vesicle protein